MNKIDEQDIKELLIENTILNIDEEFVEELTEYLNDLRYYKENDVVLRDDVINELNKVGLSEEQLQQIHKVPKVEPFK